MDDLIAWHGTQTPVTDPAGFRIKDLPEMPGGFHIGSKEQARARMHPRGALIRVRIPARHLGGISRLKDQGGNWARRLKPHARKGRCIVAYLNRFEGIGPERAAQLAEHDPARIERMSDRAFRALVPEAADSWIVLDPAIAEILEDAVTE
jgi:hypothetical protein